MDRVAAALRRDGVRPGEAIAISAGTSIEYAAVFLGALRAGVAVSPLAPSSTPASLKAMIEDCGARLLFLDRASAESLAKAGPLGRRNLKRVALDQFDAGDDFEDWLAPPGTKPLPVAIAPDAPFNIIYSSGTTGTPKGIVQPHRMRWAQVQRAKTFLYGRDAVTLVSTPLYSNTTLVAFFPTIVHGGTLVLMAKFDAAEFLTLASEAPRHPRHAGAGAISAPHGASGFRPLRSYELQDEILHQRAFPRRLEGRGAEALAGRPCRGVGHDGRRRLDTALRA